MDINDDSSFCAYHQWTFDHLIIHFELIEKIKPTISNYFLSPVSGEIQKWRNSNYRLNWDNNIFHNVLEKIIVIIGDCSNYRNDVYFQN